MVKKKDSFIQVLRAIAVFAVLVVHTTGYFTKLEFGFLQITYAFLDSIANIAVPLFVFISGYILTKVYDSRVDYFRYFKRRVIRIVPPYIFFTIFYFIFFNYPNLAPKEFLRSLLFADAAYHLPFVLLIIQLYLLFPLLLKINNGKLLIFLFFVQIGSSLFFSNEIIKFPSFLFYFVLGMYISKTNINILKKLKIPYSLVIPLIFAGLVTYFWIKGTLIFGSFRAVPESYSWKANLTRILLYIYLMIFVFFSRESIMKFIKKIEHYIVKVGNHAFGIYLLHVFYLSLIIKFVFDNQYDHPLFVIFTLAATLLLSYLTLEAFDKLQVIVKQKLLLRLFQG